MEMQLGHLHAARRMYDLYSSLLGDTSPAMEMPAEYDHRCQCCEDYRHHDVAVVFRDVDVHDAKMTTSTCCGNHHSRSWQRVCRSTSDQHDDHHKDESPGAPTSQ